MVGLKFSNVVWILIGVTLFAAVSGSIGCGPKTSAVPSSTATLGEGTEIEETLYEQLRSGSFQIDTSVSAIQESLDALRSIVGEQAGETREDLERVVAMLDSAGATLGEFGESPSLDEVKRDFSTQDERRLSMIEAANDAIEDLRTSKGVLADMVASDPPAKEKQALETAASAVEAACETVEEAVRSLGGTPRPESEIASRP